MARLTLSIPKRGQRILAAHYRLLGTIDLLGLGDLMQTRCEQCGVIPKSDLPLTQRLLGKAQQTPQANNGGRLPIGLQNFARQAKSTAATTRSGRPRKPYSAECSQRLTSPPLVRLINLGC
jgi:hypothetical protein